jgi:hypothetical protein
MKTTSAKMALQVSKSESRHIQLALVAFALETFIVTKSPMDDPTGPR